MVLLGFHSTLLRVPDRDVNVFVCLKLTDILLYFAYKYYWFGVIINGLERGEVNNIGI